MWFEKLFAFLHTWKAANIPPRDILYAITINGYKAAHIIHQRSPTKPALFADLIAVTVDQHTDIDALRSVQFAMKNELPSRTANQR
jgi:hypothetical protein